VAAALAASASGVTVKSGNIVVEFNGGFSPTKFPRKETAPLTLTLKGKLSTTDGTHLPAAKTISLDFDKAGELFTKGLPSCTVGKLESRRTPDAKRICRSALVGTGNVTADIALPEQPPFGASGPLLIFNGSKGNRQSLILHVYAHVPAPTTFVVPVAIKKVHGKYGTNAFIKVPTIVGGSGSVTSFKAKIGKRWTYKGKKVSLLNASCPTGTLFVHGDISFANGDKLNGTFSKPCTPTK
jgi:hypothetical protein